MGQVTGSVPGRLFRYSSVGFMVLGQLVEALTGERLDRALAHGITTPLGLRETGFLPKTWLSAAAQQARLVATDARSSRGLLRAVATLLPRPHVRVPRIVIASTVAS